MTLFACGYKVSQDYLKPLFQKNGHEVTPLLLAARVNVWYRCLAPEDRAGCPKIIKYVRPDDEGYQTAVYFVHTRLVAITSLEELDTVLIETEEDKKKKKRFLVVFLKGI